VIEGSIQAETEAQAAEQLLRKGLHPLSISNMLVKRRGWSLSMLRGKVSPWDLAQFTRQLSDLLGAGLTLYNALLTLEEQVENRHLKEISNDLAKQIRGGISFSVALGNYPNVFSTLYVNMVKMGEKSGALEEILDNLADFSEREDEIRKKVRNAMAYPALMSIVGIVTIIVLTVLVIPQLIVMFEEMGQVLPLPTRIMIAVSDFLTAYGWIIIAVVVLLAVGIRRQGVGLKGKIFVDKVKLGLPIFGNMLRKVELARFGRGLGILLKSGVPIIQSLEVMEKTLRNYHYRNEIHVIREGVSQGRRLGTCLKQSPYFSAFVANTVSIGEESGMLDLSLYKIAGSFEREVDQSVKLVTSLLEPVMILVIGGIIGFLVISMMLPIFQIDMILQ
jgi:type II secretory pathway component PulF